MHPMRHRPSRRGFLGALATLAGGAAAAQTAGKPWPGPSIRFIAPSAAGGPTDIIGRLIADRLSRSLKVPVVVENRPGGTGTVALDAIAKAPADGNTIGIGFTGGNVLLPLLNKNLPFDTERAFTPIGNISETVSLLLVHPSLPVTSLKEFVDYVGKRAKTEPVVYGSWGPGSGGHLAGEAIKLSTGIDMTHVPYKSTSGLATDLVGGHVKIAFLDFGNTRPLVEGGKARAIAQTSSVRSAAFPDVPTMSEQGVQFSLRVWYGLFGPAGLPRPVLDTLNRELNALLGDPAFVERLLPVTGMTPKGSTPEAFDEMVRTDRQSMRQVIEKARITLD